jgi:hypothetical protein
MVRRSFWVSVIHSVTTAGRRRRRGRRGSWRVSCRKQRAAHDLPCEVVIGGGWVLAVGQPADGVVDAGRCERGRERVVERCDEVTFA